MSVRRFHLYLLGPFRLHQDDRPVAGFDQARLQHLLAYLALHRQAPISRQQLAFSLWPDLKAVVDSAHGTGHRILFDSSYSISGKTGTAVSALDNKGYNKGNKIYQASFIGYFPSESPKYSIAVVIQNSRESKFIYGADVAGRVFKEISDRIYGRYIHNNKIKFAGLVTDSAAYRYAGMMKDLNAIFSFMKMNYYDSSVSGTWRKAQMVANSSALVSPGISGLPASIMPDVVGMGLKDALYLLENRGMKVSILGKGKVISQSLAAGSTISNGQKINLMLN